MKLPIVPYGNEILRTKCKTVFPDYSIEQLVNKMWLTLEATDGVGLAAPQINSDLNIFIVDSSTLYDKLCDDARRIFWGDTGIKETFINAKITTYVKETWIYKEGCLSLPKINIDVERPIAISIKYQDLEFNWHEKNFGGMTARIIQHEYDHTIGKLHIDYLKNESKPFLFDRKLKRIMKGKVKTDYRLINN